MGTLIITGNGEIRKVAKQPAKPPKAYEQLFSKLPYDENITGLVRELNKLMRRSRSKWRLRIRYRSSEFVDARKARAKYVSVYLRFSPEHLRMLEYEATLR